MTHVMFVCLRASHTKQLLSVIYSMSVFEMETCCVSCEVGTDFIKYHLYEFRAS
jgi:hypothetical protein